MVGCIVETLVLTTGADMSAAGAAGISAGAGLLGGYLHDRSQERINDQNLEAQREFAQMGIRWRVADAQAAGVHPLYAIGSSGASFSPSFQAGGGVARGLAEAGQDISRAMLAQKTQEERDAHEMQMALVASQIGESDARAAYYRSAAARDAQQAVAQKGFPTLLGPQGSSSVFGSGGSPVPSWMRTHPQNRDAIEMKADEVISSSPSDYSVTAGRSPAFKEYSILNDLPMLLPYSDEGPGEALENVPWWLWPSIIERNNKQYGPRWSRRFIKEFMFGQDREPEPEVRGRESQHWSGKIRR